MKYLGDKKTKCICVDVYFEQNDVGEGREPTYVSRFKPLNFNY